MTASNFEWWLDYVLFSLMLLAGISFIIYNIYKHITREFDTTEKVFEWKLYLMILGLCLVFGYIVYQKTFPDRWNCPSCEQVNIYNVEIISNLGFGSIRLVDGSANARQTCRSCEEVFERPIHFKSSEPFYSLP